MPGSVTDPSFALTPEQIQELTQPPVAVNPTGGQGVRLDEKGHVPASVISGYPNDATKALKGDGTWAAVTGAVVAPAHLPSIAVPPSATLSGITNIAILSPVPNVVATGTYTRLGFALQTSSGNMDAGVYYSDDEATFTRLASTGSIATPAATMAVVSLTFTITPVAGRRWYFAVAFDNGTVVLHVANSNNYYGVRLAASFPLPATLTGTTGSTYSAAMVAMI